VSECPSCAQFHLHSARTESERRAEIGQRAPTSRLNPFRLINRRVSSPSENVQVSPEMHKMSPAAAAAATTEDDWLASRGTRCNS